MLHGDLRCLRLFLNAYLLIFVTELLLVGFLSFELHWESVSERGLPLVFGQAFVLAPLDPVHIDELEGELHTQEAEEQLFGLAVRDLGLGGLGYFDNDVTNLYDLLVVLVGVGQASVAGAEARLADLQEGQ